MTNASVHLTICKMDQHVTNVMFRAKLVLDQTKTIVQIVTQLTTEPFL
jgi:hypothetical protein